MEALPKTSGQLPVLKRLSVALPPSVSHGIGRFRHVVTKAANVIVSLLLQWHLARPAYRIVSERASLPQVIRRERLSAAAAANVKGDSSFPAALASLKDVICQFTKMKRVAEEAIAVSTSRLLALSLG